MHDAPPLPTATPASPTGETAGDPLPALPGSLTAADLRALTDSLPLGLIVMETVQSRVLHLNHEAERLTGLRRAQLLGQPATEQLGEALAALCQPARWRLLADSAAHASGATSAAHASTVRETLLLPTPLGPRWLQLQRSLIAWSGLRRPAGLLSLQDVSAQRQLERALQESDARFREVTEAVRECLFVTTAGWDRLHYSSPLLLELLGATPMDLREGPALLEQRLHPDDRALYARRLQAQARGEASDMVLRLRHASLGWRWMRMRTRPQQHSSGQTLIYVILADISDEHEQHRELARARDLAEAASRAKSEFMATMSHEIRTPLNGMLGMTELLLGSALQPEQRRHAESALSSARQLLHLIEDVLDFAGLQAGETRLQAQTYQPAALAREALAALSLAAAAKGVLLQLDLDPALPAQAQADTGKLRQVLDELLDNALKFTAQGRISLQLRPEAQAVGGVPGLVYRVRDTGIGIDSRLLPRLFSPFTQGNASLSRPFGGTGMGLAKAQGLARLMGGSLAYCGEPGPGACFELRLPLLAPAPGSPGAPAAPPALGRQADVLVVDDNQVNQEVCAEMLLRLGCRVQICDDGPSALRAMCAQRFDLVLMDIHMPGMDGMQTLSAFRRGNDAEHTFLCPPTTPVIAVTANALRGDEQKLRQHGFDDYLAKPLRLEALQTLLLHWLGGGNNPNLVAALPEPGDASLFATPMSATPASSAAPAAPSVLDAQALDRLRELDPSGGNKLLERVINAYLRSLERLLPELAQARQAGMDLGTVRHVTHTLKSSSASLGALTLSQRCAEIETMARNGQTEGLDNLLDAMHDELALVRQALNELIAPPQ